MTRERLLTTWLSRGMEIAQGNRKAGLAFLKLESARSREIYKELTGQVDLEDWKRVFQMLVESFGLKQVRLEVIKKVIKKETAKDDADLSRNHDILPGNDGMTIYLPESVSLFARQEDNFGYYKVSLLHQLGYFEFGCFAQLDIVEKAISEMEPAGLARKLFTVAEDARIDWQLERRFKGVAAQLANQKRAALARRRRFPPATPVAACIEYLVRLGLDADEPAVLGKSRGVAPALRPALTKLRDENATVADSLTAMMSACKIIAPLGPEAEPGGETKIALTAESPPPVEFRGELDVDKVQTTLRLDAIVRELAGEQLEAGRQPDDSSPATAIINPELLDPQNINLDNIKKGDAGEGVRMLMDELKRKLEQTGESASDAMEMKKALAAAGIARGTGNATTHVYDEWDHEIADYRSRWCTLHEMKDLPLDEQYVLDAMSEHAELARRVRRQLGRLGPQMLARVKGRREGDELDLERAIGHVVDRKTGLAPEENIYIERQRKERDVATLFLLDMSASTDDIIPGRGNEPEPPGGEDDDDSLFRYFEERRRYERDARRIIDLEKEAVALMAAALEELGDSYSVCGFSGYGRERVEYFLCKDFDEPYDANARGRIGGIKPRRSTRMGAPIRHATRSLLNTGARVKALIIISDGYPQDHDYCGDRDARKSSDKSIDRDYGLNDTMKALMEARRQGVLAYCLTVDPSGNDYLRTMCPDSQYMVIQDIEQLPEELSRVYRSLTA